MSFNRDIFDIDPHWRQEEKPVLTTFKIHSKIVKKTFYQNKEDAAAVLRLYYIAKHHFSNKGYFKDSELAAVLTDHYDYNVTNRGSILRLSRTLQNAPGLFKQTKPHYYIFKSYRRLLGLHKKSDAYITADLSVLSKKNKKAFTDILIVAQASGQTLSMQNLTNQTGICRARIYQVKDLDRFNVIATVNAFKNEDEARRARKEYYKTGILSRVIFSDGVYKLVFTIGNYFKALKQNMSCDGTDAVKAANKKRIEEMRKILGLNACRGIVTSKKKAEIVYRSKVFQVLSNVIVTALDVVTGKEIQFIEAVFLEDQLQPFIERHSCI